MSDFLPGARLWSADMLYAARVQASAVLSQADPAGFERPVEPVRRPVLLLAGVFETWHFILPIARALHGRGHPVYVVPDLGYNRLSIPDSADVVAAFLQERGLSEIAVVSHSKGGLITKYLMVDSPPLVHMAVTVCTPYSGSRYAKWAPTRTLRIFAPGDETTRTLAANLEANGRITSVWGSFDPVVPDGSALEGARNIRLPVPGHFRILASPRLREVILTALDE
jgi:pimeloyl-ACP methyl ester carboxylesterase